MIEFCKLVMINELKIKEKECLDEINKTKCNDMWNCSRLDLIEELLKFIEDETC